MHVELRFLFLKGGVENILKLMVARLCEYTKNYGVVLFR